MNAVPGLCKPECRVMLMQKRFYAIQPRRKKQPKSTSGEVDSLFKVLNVQSNSVKSQNSVPQRTNEFNIQMLSESLYKQLYSHEVQQKPNSLLIEKAREKLKKYGLGAYVNYQDDVELKLPQLRGDDIQEHFWNIGNEQAKPYRDLLEELISAKLPEPPKLWVFQPGWTKYSENKKPVQVQYPDESALVLDVEVCMKIGYAPTLATAISSKAWYSWVSPLFVEEKEYFPSPNLELLIPLVKFDKPSVVVGHSVSFDRAYIKEEYNINPTGLRFLDTMALHTSIGKLTSKRQLYVSYISLKELYQLYCNKILNKEKRSVFLTGGLSDIKTDFQNLMAYCASDSKATFEVFQVIFPKFLQHFPHPVTLAGMLEMSMGYLPVNQNWRRYVRNSSESHDDLNSEILRLISRKTDDTCRLLHNDEYKNDLWMWGESWKTQKLKLTKKKIKSKTDVENFADEEERDLHDKFKYLFDLEERLPNEKKLPFLPGYPLWYRLLRKDTERAQISPGKLIMPKLLRVKWENFPLHHVTRLGWGILIPDVHAKEINTSIPFEKLKALTVKNLSLDLNKLDPVESVEAYYKGDGLWCNRLIDNCCYFFKLQNNIHKGRNVRTIFSKNFTLLNTTLSSEDSTTKRVLDISEKTSFWRECKSLVNNEMVVWLDDERGVILPRVLVCGTVTRRASEKLWLKTIPENAVGSELRSMVQAPVGYHIVGGHIDLDLWIASLFGDSASLKIHGSTPLGWVTLNGIDSSINSIIAKYCNLPIRQAEYLTSSRLYGSGVLTTEKLLKKLNPNMSSEQVKRLARKIYNLTKGVKLCRMKYSNKVYFIKKARQLCRTRQKLFEDLFLKPFWYGGMESSTHNSLEALVTIPCPVTPFLSSRLSEALEEEEMKSKKFGSMVQSSGVDFLHLMLVCMRWLTNGRARYCFSFHNEVRYLIQSEDRYNGALALHISSLLVKAFCSHRLGMIDLPLSVAFFPTVGVDTTLRKEVRNEYITPSNPHGLEKGYGVAPGEALNIYEAIEKSGGSLETFRRKT